VLPFATGIAIVGLALLSLLTPPWTNAALAASNATAAFASPADALALSNRTVAELVLGPGSFDIRLADGMPAYSAAERAHMADVRAVLMGYLAVAAIGLVLVVYAAAVHGRDQRTWRAIARGGASVAALMVALGVFALVAFETGFELFHRLLFPGGNWAFDPAMSNLVTLYPLAFWQLSAAALGGLTVATGVLTWLLATRRAGRLAAGEG